MTMNEARAAVLDIPADKRNNNCVQDGQRRVREKLRLAEQFYADDAEAPNYVIEAIRCLRSWF